MFRVVQKLKLLKKELKLLHRQDYKNIEARAKEAQRDLSDAQQLVHDNTNDPTLARTEKGCYEKFIKLREIES